MTTFSSRSPNEAPNRVLCIGDIALDVIVKLEVDGGVEGFSQLRYGSDTPSRVVTRGGGAAANVASWLATTEMETDLLLRIGDDSVGTALVTELQDQGIHCHVRTIPGMATGTVVVLVDRSGERTMLPDSGANAGLDVADLPPLNGYGAAYISGYALFNKSSHDGVLEIFDELHRSNIPVIFDPASVGTMSTFADRDQIIETLPKSDVMILNESEARFLVGGDPGIDAPVEELLTALTRHSQIVVIKRNESGAVAMDGATGLTFSDRQPRKDPVDTTGAGDSFAAGFIAEWSKSRDLLAAIKSGNQMAGRCVEVIGARPAKSR